MEKFRELFEAKRMPLDTLYDYFGDGNNETEIWDTVADEWGIYAGDTVNGEKVDDIDDLFYALTIKQRKQLIKILGA